MDISPISAVQVSPIHSDMVFMELLTRHAPVPQERNIIPTLPITEAFSFRLATAGKHNAVYLAEVHEHFLFKLMNRQ